MIEIFFDGACEPKNPGGTCGFGCIVRIDGKKAFEKAGSLKPSSGDRITTSNNVAEYIALNQALHYILIHPEMSDAASSNVVYIYGDSKLVIEQMSGRWRIKAGIYVPFAEQCQMHLTRLKRLGFIIELKWIPRDKNTECDKLSKRELKELGIKFRIQPED